MVLIVSVPDLRICFTFILYDHGCHFSYMTWTNEINFLTPAQGGAT